MGRHVCGVGVEVCVECVIRVIFFLNMHWKILI